MPIAAPIRLFPIVSGIKKAIIRESASEDVPAYDARRISFKKDKTANRTFIATTVAVVFKMLMLSDLQNITGDFKSIPLF